MLLLQYMFKEGRKNMDNLVEQVVKRSKDSKYFVKLFAIILSAILIPVTFMVLALVLVQGYLVTIGLFAAIVCVYGVWFFVSSLNVEYEYASLSGVFRVDKIIAKRNRKKVVKIHVKDIEEIFKYSDEQMSKRSFKKIYNVGKSDYSDDNYVLTFSLDSKRKSAVVFSPEDKMLESFKPYLKREVYKEFFLK